MSDALVVQARGVTKAFRRGTETVHALRGVDVMVAPGEVVGVAGASGSGKSTLLAVLCGWERPDSGTVEHVDGPVGGVPWDGLALVPQTLGLLDDLPALENVLLPARLTGQHRQLRERALELFERLGAAHLAGRYGEQMSLGEQQRVAIARALLLRPRLILADEPTAHQDHGWADVVLQLLREHAAQGGSSVLVSHHRQALESTDRLLTMSDGRLQGTHAA